jgi:hypothetical protein
MTDETTESARAKRKHDHTGKRERNGATRLPAFDEARRGGLNTREGGKHIRSKTNYKGDETVEATRRRCCRRQDPRGKEKGSVSAESLET